MCDKVIDLIVHQLIFASFELQNVCWMLCVESEPKGEVVWCFHGTTYTFCVKSKGVKNTQNTLLKTWPFGYKSNLIH
jgi:hypothetical protein